MKWLNTVGAFVWQFLAVLGGLAILFNVVQPVANGIWVAFGANAMTLIALGVVSLAAAGVGTYFNGGNSGS